MLVSMRRQQPHWRPLQKLSAHRLNLEKKSLLISTATCIRCGLLRGFVAASVNIVNITHANWLMALLSPTKSNAGWICFPYPAWQIEGLTVKSSKQRHPNSSKPKMESHWKDSTFHRLTEVNLWHVCTVSCHISSPSQLLTITPLQIIIRTLPQDNLVQTHPRKWHTVHLAGPITDRENW